jgi:hypothetical protein
LTRIFLINNQDLTRIFAIFGFNSSSHPGSARIQPSREPLPMDTIRGSGVALQPPLARPNRNKSILLQNPTKNLDIRDSH